MELEEGTNIHSGTGSMLQRNTINGSTVSVVKEKADIEEAKQPSACRGTSTIKDGIGSGWQSGNTVQLDSDVVDGVHFASSQ